MTLTEWAVWGHWRPAHRLHAVPVGAGHHWELRPHDITKTLVTIPNDAHHRQEPRGADARASSDPKPVIPWVDGLK